MEYVTKKTFAAGNYTVSYQDGYTYINSFPFEDSTVESSYMIPDGSFEKIEIENGVCRVLIPSDEYYKSLGFNHVYEVRKYDHGEYHTKILCDNFTPTENTPKIQKITTSYVADENGNPEECLSITF